MTSQDKSQKTAEALRYRFGDIIGTVAAFTTAAVITTVCRVLSKRLTHAPFVLEDYAIFLCLVLFVVSEVLVVIGIVATVIGQRPQRMNDYWDQKHTLVVYVYSLFVLSSGSQDRGLILMHFDSFYFTIVALAIVSVLLLYRRIFITRTMRYATTSLLSITSIWWIMCTICEIIFPGSLPSTFPANPQLDLPVSYLAWWFAAGVIEQTIIFVTILLPLWGLSRLRLSLHKRVTLIIVFATSSLCLASGISRLALLYRVGASTIDVAMGDVLFNVHLGAAIMSANLPLCWPIISHRRELAWMVLRSGSRHSSGNKFSSPTTHRSDMEEGKPSVDQLETAASSSWNGNHSQRDGAKIRDTSDTSDTFEVIQTTRSSLPTKDTDPSVSGQPTDWLSVSPSSTRHSDDTQMASRRRETMAALPPVDRDSAIQRREEVLEMIKALDT